MHNFVVLMLRWILSVVKYSLPHLLLFLVATMYTFAGAQVFYMIEKPEEHAWKLEGKEKIFREANKLMMYLVTLKSTDLSSMIAEDNLQPLEHRIATVLSKTYELAKMHYLDPEDLLDPHSTPEGRRWTFASSFLFSFTLITTIGYGNLTPVTMNGRVFCIIYGLFGIPLVMITIANTGRFMFDGMVAILEVLRRAFACLVGRIRRTDKTSSRRRSIVEMISHSHPESGTSVGSPGVVLAFFSHIFLGAMILPQWEDMDFFSAFYFSFVTITTVGFGDIVPRKYDYLPLTLAYVTVGLALATLMVQVMGHYLRKLHYIGRKIMNASGAFVWFGNKMLTVNDLVAVIGRKYGMSITQIAHLQADLDTVIIETVKEKSELVKKKRGVASSTATATLLPNGQYFDRQFSDAQVHELHVIYDNFVRSLSEILDYCTFLIIKFFQVEPFIRGRRKKRVEIINQQDEFNWSSNFISEI
ncbi:TWiK family of potassium channels protein 7 [Trichinella nelsoni]|uniref:TWiK family of potassium channels protein 7 n=1 Tax=Trichinella nelsoni TaxID=6336 RepID=A0A0V0SEL3_9BILA|nr:TWiK family of potassium channels protein 7 [Trichinella nelsoni]